MSLLLLLLNFTLPGVMNQGDRVFYTSARSLALGGITSVLEDGDNPGVIGLINEISLFTSAELINCNEKRGLRVYDSYGNNMGISTLSNNTFVNVTLGASSITIPIEFLRIGIKYLPLWDFNYFYHREYRDDFYQITKTVEDKHTGNIYALCPVLGLTYNFINIGIEEKFLFGQRFREYRIVFPHAADSLSQSETNYNGTTTKFGVVIYPNIHFRFSYAYTFKYILKTEDQSENLSYPESHSVGFQYQPAGRIPTKFLCEIDCEKWDEPIFIYKVGVEHTILNRYAMRCGFCVFPDYNQKSVWTTDLTFGVGLNSDRYYFDLGFGYSKRDYSSSCFDNLGVSEENLKFDESIFHSLLSCGVTF